MPNLQLSFFGAPQIADGFTGESRTVVHLGDTYEFLRALPDGIATLVITSPPYNIGKEYEVRQSIQQYLKQQEQVIAELVRVLDERGSICWEVGNYVEN